MQKYGNVSEGPGKRTSMSRRSPSILVTDARSSRKRLNAPFAGHAAGLQNANPARNGPNRESSPTPMGSNSLRRGSSTDLLSQRKLKNKLRQQGKFSDISIDNILSDLSDVPSGRREERMSTSSNDHHFRNSARTARYTKMINPLPPRTSKTSQKLVLIPEDADRRSSHREPRKLPRSSSKPEGVPFGKNDKELSRITAYNVAEGFNLKLASNFLKNMHDVSPRLYDECLYVPYCLPLLPGKEGFRIKSNASKKMIGGKTLMDRLIDTSEQRDHHYEYYSGVETVEDINNNFELNESNSNDDRNDIVPVPDHLPNLNSTTTSFDPSEPQYFAEETPREQELREQEERLQSTTEGDHSRGSISQVIDASETSKKQHAEIFIFSYGVVVFWNFTEVQEKNILGDIAFADYDNLVIRPLDEQDIETEQFHFEYDMDTERPSIFNDIVTLRSGDHITKLTLSHSIAQSTKLSRFESRISPILSAVSKLPKRLALYGTLGLKREQLLKKSGKLFKLRVDVNLSSSVLDTPEFFWSFEPSLHPLYLAMREYLEIDQRVQVLNDRCKVFLEFFDICVDSVAERNMARITWWFIAVIFVSVLVSIAEILVRSFIIRKLKQHP
ncbi:LAFE_0F17788g1_1 [Lachancea fermentati]|uniref:LAFE_0F17788g1_1 n=1 Tax=Lachancea fermentati TaxID=4955 RepID=A0A1G4MGV2_LACFM|nr:LAFE_0F17788g1_1 [Lachancea fermentati]